MKQFLIPFIIVCMIGICSSSYGSSTQDTLVLQKQKNKDKKFRIPFNSLIVLKQKNGKKIEASIVGYTDTTLEVKTYSNEAYINKAIAKMYKDSSMNNLQMDSIETMIRFYFLQTIKICEIKRIEIMRRDRKDLKWVLNAANLTAFSWMISQPILISLIKPFPFLLDVSIGAAIAMSAILAEVKYLKFNKWEISH